MRRWCRNLFLTMMCAVIFMMPYTCLVHAVLRDFIMRRIRDDYDEIIIMKGRTYGRDI